MPFMRRTINWFLDQLSTDARLILFITIGVIIAVSPIIAGCTLILWLMGYQFSTAVIAACLTIFGVPLYIALCARLGCKKDKGC